MNPTDKKRIAIIGAGPSGITAAKELISIGLKNIIVFEKNNKVGGNWIYSEKKSHSSVFETTHIISSKKHSAYSDFPMPDDYPDYPSHKQLLKYFQDYAIYFGILPYIRFNTEIIRAEPIGEQWKLFTTDENYEVFDYLLVANGHHWDPRMPELSGKFEGELIHSHDYKNSKLAANKRVLVIGGGNSACDIAVETSRLSEYTAISMRRGYYIIPKFMFGKPVDTVNEKVLFLPLWLRKPILKLGWKIEVGKMANYGLLEPNYPILYTHPVTNSELLYFLRHGKIHPRKNIDRVSGKRVYFSDGQSDEYDLIIACTGFKITFPFFSKDLIDFDSHQIPLYLRTFHPDFQNLFFIGLVQPQGCIWPLAEAQSKLVAAFICGKYNLPKNLKQLGIKEANMIKNNFLDSPRHNTEVHFHEYLKLLKKEFRKAKN